MDEDDDEEEELRPPHLGRTHFSASEKSRINPCAARSNPLSKPLQFSRTPRSPHYSMASSKPDKSSPKASKQAPATKAVAKAAPSRPAPKAVPAKAVPAKAAPAKAVPAKAAPAKLAPAKAAPVKAGPAKVAPKAAPAPVAPAARPKTVIANGDKKKSADPRTSNSVHAPLVDHLANSGKQTPFLMKQRDRLLALR